MWEQALKLCVLGPPCPHQRISLVLRLCCVLVKTQHKRNRPVAFRLRFNQNATQTQQSIFSVSSWRPHGPEWKPFIIWAQVKVFRIWLKLLKVWLKSMKIKGAVHKIDIHSSKSSIFTFVIARLSCNSWSAEIHLLVGRQAFLHLSKSSAKRSMTATCVRGDTCYPYYIQTLFEVPIFCQDFIWPRLLTLKSLSSSLGKGGT